MSHMQTTAGGGPAATGGCLSQSHVAFDLTVCAGHARRCAPVASAPCAASVASVLSGNVARTCGDERGLRVNLPSTVDSISCTSPPVRANRAWVANDVNGEGCASVNSQPAMGADMACSFLTSRRPNQRCVSPDSQASVGDDMACTTQRTVQECASPDSQATVGGAEAAKERDSAVSPTPSPVLGVGRAEVFKGGRGEDSGRVRSVNRAKEGGDDADASVASVVSSFFASMDQSPVLGVRRVEFESDFGRRRRWRRGAVGQWCSRRGAVGQWCSRRQTHASGHSSRRG